MTAAAGVSEAAAAVAAERTAPLLTCDDGGSEVPPSPTPSTPRRRRGLGVLAVAAIVFFNVSGGPLGSEQVVSAAGPLIGLLTLCGFTLLYSVPQAMLTAELSTAFPENGGYSLWVQAAFGDLWGVQESYWSWFSGVVDNALYPVLLYSCAQQLFSSLPSGEADCDKHHGHDEEAPLRNLWGCLFTEGAGDCGRELGIKLLVLLAFATPNLLSDHLVGHGLFFLALFVMAPFVAIAALGLPSLSLQRLLRRPPKYKISQLLSVAYWNVSGFDSASTFAGEVRDPKRTFPRALGTAVLLMLAGYVLPLGVGAGVDPEWECWRDGSLTYVATLVGGHWLAVWVLISSTLGNWGLFSSELLEDSYQLHGMAEAGLAPLFLGKRHSRLHTPVNAIVLQLIIIGVLVGLDFKSILCVDNFFSAASAALEFLAAIRLRVTRPDLPRPYRIPLSTSALALLFAGPVVINVVVMWVTVTDSYLSLIVTMTGTVIGFLGYAVVAVYDYRARRFPTSAGYSTPHDSFSYANDDDCPCDAGARECKGDHHCSRERDGSTSAG